MTEKWKSVQKDGPPPEEIDEGKEAGWSSYMECVDLGEGEIVEGVVVFTAFYRLRDGWVSYHSGKKCSVTHYRPLPTLESIK